MRLIVDVLLHNLRLGHSGILHSLMRLLLSIWRTVVHPNVVGICGTDGGRQRRGHLWQSSWYGRNAVSLKLAVSIRDRWCILERFRFQLESLRVRIEVFVVADRWRYAIELQPYAGGAWPRIGGRRIAFDLAATTALACSHHYTRSANITAVGLRSCCCAAPFNRLCRLCSSTKT